ncbi:MAG TPA: S41 family peptidase [Candidatus Thioglobus sp.]|jgi:carboxyl-terminal processing protease|nr:S41 family peptidase [Candidatus Thioglobus sp.]
MTFLSRPFKSTLLLLSLFITGFVNTCYADEQYSPLESPDFFKELSTFTTVYTQIKKYYVDEVDDKTLFENAIQGMLEGLDPYSTHLNPADQADLVESTMGQFGGLGIVIATQGELIQIISPIDDTPAYRAGLQAGDLILKIDDQYVSEINLQDGVKLMRGLPGTKVSLTIRRADQAPFELEIKREIITITSVRGYLLEDGMAYIRISNFQLPSARLLKKLVAKLTHQNNGELSSLILDLRNNPGGALAAAIDVSNLFIDSTGIVVYTEGRVDNASMRFDTERGDILNGAPMITLINKGSASASEIVAGALQDHNRSIIMGQTSFGKGSVQSLIDLEGGYGMKLTTARFYTPSGNVIQDKGISPDITLEKPTMDEVEEESDTEEMQDSENHLNGDPTKLNEDEILERQDAIKEKTDKEVVEFLLQDYGVQQAMSHLRALTTTNII